MKTSGKSQFIVVVALLLALVWAQHANAWANLLEDPGFKNYRLDRRGFYRPRSDSKWVELAMGRGSVQMDMNGWEAPEQMVRERPLGFTPGTTGYEGEGPEQNTGRIILQQDVVLQNTVSTSDQFYEAWIWLGGAGRDDNNKNGDREDETGGWEIFFYGKNEPSAWTEVNTLEHHHMSKDFWGKPGSFVQVSGFGRIPANTKGIRMRVWASTWGQASKGGERAGFDAEVAIDNAHFAIIAAPNMLINGDFELDDRVGEFKGWQRPAEWPFPRDGLKPLGIRDVFAGNFDHGQYRPFYGGRRSYGYATYLSGWVMDAFTFGQYVDYTYPDKTELVLMFNWIQAAASGGEQELRLIGSKVEIVVDYLGRGGRLGAQSFWLDWPAPFGAGCVGRYDQNSGQPFSPRLVLNPPAGTKRVGVHVNFMVHAPYKDGFRLINAAVDDFFLVPTKKL
jgi:hypothetical protein